MTEGPSRKAAPPKHLGTEEGRGRPAAQLVDHLVYATPDLASTVDALSHLLGTRLVAGGKHPGRGSENALLGLGSGAYLEVIGPDVDAANPVPRGGRPFGIDDLTAARLVGWAIAVPSLEEAVRVSKSRGYDPGSVTSLSRRRPDGEVLEWRVSRRADGRLDGGGIVPFLIDWGSCPHPSVSATQGVRLTELRGEHPDRRAVTQDLAALEVHLPLSEGPEPRLVATFESPNGLVEFG